MDFEECQWIVEGFSYDFKGMHGMQWYLFEGFHVSSKMFIGY